jgi:hypothetical protein
MPSAFLASSSTEAAAASSSQALSSMWTHRRSCCRSSPLSSRHSSSSFREQPPKESMEAIGMNQDPPECKTHTVLRDSTYSSFSFGIICHALQKYSIFILVSISRPKALCTNVTALISFSNANTLNVNYSLGRETHPMEHAQNTKMAVQCWRHCTALVLRNFLPSIYPPSYFVAT